MRAIHLRLVVHFIEHVFTLLDPLAHLLELLVVEISLRLDVLELFEDVLRHLVTEPDSRLADNGTVLNDQHLLASGPLLTPLSWLARLIIGPCFTVLLVHRVLGRRAKHSMVHSRSNVRLSRRLVFRGKFASMSLANKHQRVELISCLSQLRSRFSLALAREQLLLPNLHVLFRVELGPKRLQLLLVGDAHLMCLLNALFSDAIDLPAEDLAELLHTYTVY